MLDTNLLPIQTLSEETINQIAAGEVIEKPSCIIRELLDNAIDAGSDEIEIRVDFHNLVIEIKDNGCGILAEQLPLAFKRHTTSKIHQFEDIFSINTLGFRGEALAAIASISEVRVETSCQEDGLGHLFRLKGGEEVESTPIACPKGTKIVISNLFYNTPVRKKFLSSHHSETSPSTPSSSSGLSNLSTNAPKLKSAERNHIKQEILRHILSCDGIGFKYYIVEKQEKLEISIPKQCGFKEKILTFFKSNAHSQPLEKCLLPVDQEFEGLRFKGYITNLHIRERRSDKQFLILRNRVIREPLFLKAISTAYLHKIPWGNHPMVFLKVSCQKNDKIDINVHPRKEQVKFQNNQWFFKAVYEVVKNNLKQAYAPNTPTNDTTNDSIISDEGYSVSHQEKKYALGEPTLDSINPPAPPEFKPAFDENASFQLNKREELFDIKKIPANQQPASESQPSFNQQSVKVLGQLADGYILFSIDNDLYIVDQHAAHERINFDYLFQQVKSQAPDQQMLLVPLLIEKSVMEKEMILNHQEELQGMGFEIDDFGKTTIKVSRVPAYLPEKKVHSVVEAILEMMAHTPAVVGTENQNQFLGEMIARMACRMSIMSGDKLSQSAMEEIVKEIYSKGYVQTCPHGRPFVKKIDFNEMKAFFDRGRHLSKEISPDNN